MMVGITHFYSNPNLRCDGVPNLLNKRGIAKKVINNPVKDMHTKKIQHVHFTSIQPFIPATSSKAISKEMPMV
jgi:hypothetical protein